MISESLPLELQAFLSFSYHNFLSRQTFRQQERVFFRDSWINCYNGVDDENE